jgi:protein transport protein SEC24
VRSATGRVLFPPLIRVSVARLNPAGAYLLENGQCMFLWLGRDIPSNYLMDVFGVSSLDEVDPSLVSFLSVLNSMQLALIIFLSRVYS